ncbi:MAG: ATP-binding protein [Phycisphaerae bacterium]
MRESRSHVARVLRWVQWISVAVAISVAVFVVSSNRQNRQAVAKQVRERNLLKMRAAKNRIEYYANEIRLCLQLISAYPRVMALSPESQRYLQTVYESNYEQLRLSEIYVIKRDFTGLHEPFRTFEQGDAEHDIGELHALEREEEEYAVQLEHIRRFAADPSLGFLVSEPVELCIGEQGRVFSVPIRSDDEFLGIVAGMVPSQVVSEELEHSSLFNWVLLAHEGGSVVGCTDFPPEMLHWFRNRFETQPATEFFEQHDHVFTVNGYNALWTTADIPDDRAWFIAFLYDEARFLREGGVTTTMAGWGAAIVALLLGGAVVVLCRVIVALMRARRQADERARALSESEAKTQAIANYTYNWESWVGPDGKILWINPAVERITGYTVEECLAMPDYPSRLIHPDDRAMIAEWFRKAVTERTTGNDLTFRMRRKDRTVRWGAVSWQPIFGSDGKCLGHRSSIRDITKRIRAEDTIRRHSEILERTVEERTAELEAAKKRAESNSRAKSAFLANMSHELRTPLHGILSFAGFGMRAGDEADTGRDELRNYFQKINDSGQTLLALLNDLLDLAKLETGAMAFEFRTIDLRALVDAVVEEFGALAAERKLSIHWHDPGFDATTRIDPQKMKQVIRNLLSNAVKFSPEGGGITVEMRQAGDTVVVCVSDDGPGIPEAELESVFDKFVQSSKTKTGAGGTGLGLAICRQIMTPHKGRVWVRNRPDGGAEFSVELPLARETSVASPRILVDANDDASDT